MSCPHELHEMETACADGLCPLCLQDRLREVAGLLGDAEGYVDMETACSCAPTDPEKCLLCRIRAALAAAQPEEKPSQHGPRTVRCICPGCGEAVPACWESQMCSACVNEDCEHQDAAVQAEEKRP